MVRIKSVLAIAYLAELFCKMAAVPESKASVRERQRSSRLKRAESTYLLLLDNLSWTLIRGAGRGSAYMLVA